MTFISNPATVTLPNDLPIVEYSGTGLGAQTINDYVDGRNQRLFTVGLRYTAGGTLTLKVYVSTEDVSSGSVSSWEDKSTELLGAASVTAKGIYSFTVDGPYRWLKFEWVLTSTGNSLAYEIWEGRL